MTNISGAVPSIAELQAQLLENLDFNQKIAVLEDALEAQRAVVNDIINRIAAASTPALVLELQVETAKTSQILALHSEALNEQRDAANSVINNIFN